MNDQRGVHIEVEGARGSLLAFEEELLEAPPRQARILEVERSWIPAEGDADFRIEESRGAGSPRVSILPDLATCPAKDLTARDPSHAAIRKPDPWAAVGSVDVGVGLVHAMTESTFDPRPVDGNPRRYSLDSTAPSRV